MSIRQRKPVGYVTHSAHFYDGRPLCWTMDQEGRFNATKDEAAVTCEDCKKELSD